jgi:chorismate mutase
MQTLAIRGAATADANTEEAILAAARDLLTEIASANHLVPEEVISILFTMTPDLDAAFPTRAARELGWTQVPLLDAQQPRVRGDLARCIRVLLHFQREQHPESIHHVYLGAARVLRPDWSTFQERGNYGNHHETQRDGSGDRRGRSEY